MDGLFGQTPWEIQQGMNQQINQGADAYARQQPLERAAAGMYRAGGMLAAPLAGALGMENPAIAQAKRTEQIMDAGDADLTTSKGLLAKAEQFRQAGDIRTATALLMKGKEMERQEQAAALASRKQDFQERQLMDEKIAKRMQDLEIAKMRSEDTRLASADRLAAAKEANQIKLQIAEMMADVKRATSGVLTPAQRLKQEQAAAKSSSTLRSMETDLNTLKEEATAINTSKGLEGATGVKGMFPSYPSGEAAQTEAKLAGFKNRVKLVGLNLVRQGGGIGAMTEKEWPIVEGMVANIDPVKLGKKGTQDAIDRVVAKMEQFYNNAKLQHEDTYGGASDKPSNGAMEFRTPDDVKKAYKAGKLDRESAKAMLKDMRV